MKYFELADKFNLKYLPKYSKYGNGLQIDMWTNNIDPGLQ